MKRNVRIGIRMAVALVMATVLYMVYVYMMPRYPTNKSDSYRASVIEKIKASSAMFKSGAPILSWDTNKYGRVYSVASSVPGCPQLLDAGDEYYDAQGTKLGICGGFWRNGEVTAPYSCADFEQLTYQTADYRSKVCDAAQK